MKITLWALAGILSLFLLNSCGDRMISDETMNQLGSENEIHDWLVYIENTDAAIEMNGERFESLVFTSEFEETKSIFWYQGDTLRIIRQQIRDLKTNNQTEISFYFNARGLLLVQELIDSAVDEDEIQTTEYVTLYENQMPIRSWGNDWYGGFADPLQYKDVAIRKSDFTRSMDMFALENDFALTFDDFIVNEHDVYLLVETVGKTPYIAALKVEQLDEFLSELYNNKSKHKKKPIKVDYQVLNEQGWIFSYYRSGQFK